MLLPAGIRIIIGLILCDIQKDIDKMSERGFIVFYALLLIATAIIRIVKYFEIINNTNE